MTPFRATLAVFSLTLAATPAMAQQDSGAKANILGAWGFESRFEEPGVCERSLTGDVVIRQTPDPDVYECTMTARDLCPGAFDYRAEQTCVASRDGDSLVIESTILSVEPPSASYWPDNFRLRIIDSQNMVGDLDSAVITKARFFRRPGPIA